jgi:cytoskeletal protein CcmA (bactofilin family)
MDVRDPEFQERRLSAWVGKDLRIRGDMAASADLVIAGQVEGTIELGDHSLTILAGASVVAELVAKSVSITGSVRGNVTGHARVDLRAGSVVEGDITTPLLVMEEGAVLHGRVDVAGRHAGPTAG